MVVGVMGKGPDGRRWGVCHGKNGKAVENRSLGVILLRERMLRMETSEKSEKGKTREGSFADQPPQVGKPWEEDERRAERGGKERGDQMEMWMAGLSTQ